MHSRSVVLAVGAATILAVPPSSHVARARGDICASVDTTIIETAAAIVVAEPSVDRAWPGFATRLAFGLVRPDTVAVVVGATPPAGFEPLECSGLPAKLRGRISAHVGSWNGHGAGIQPLVDGNALVGVSVGLRSSPAATADLIVHEAFHLAYQFKHFNSALSLQRELPADVHLDSTTAARLAFELDGLARVLSHADAPSRQAGTATYLRVRDARLAAMGGNATAAEGSMEYLEGTAEYVGLAAALAVQHPREDSVRLASRMRDTVAALLRASASDIREHGLQRDLRPRCYYTGAALAALLDDRSRTWRADVETGQPLDALLRT